jgi:gluconate 2-dehydrogenase gamma chain
LIETKLSRRAFLARSGAAAGSSIIVLSVPMIISASSKARAAQASNADFTTLTADEAAEFAAIAARIIPSDGSPGATEAGAIYFMDTVLGDSHRETLPEMQEGLKNLQTLAQTTYGSATFHTLTAEQQDKLLTDIENTPFFRTMRFMTIAGTFTLPEYGGNRDHIGWKMIGFEDRHMWMSPYGFYDADYAAKGE